ncbi:MAG TPA: isoprenylcysteine carboxylmethyltransferase family protein [Bacillota bacterium]|nr:isoprenylcysteine carboxylmethyltransferase family protein [Bacillota bacterium]
MSQDHHKLTIGKLLFTFVYILIFPALLLLLSGDWLWVEGWIFNLWFMALCFTTILYLYRNDPALLAERYQKPGAANQKGWDQYVVIGLVIGFTAWIILMPLDAKRYQWTTFFPLGLKVVGGISLIFSSFLFFRSYTDNTFLSPLVRVQTERKHQVVSTGVYGWVRHPMYLGGSLLFIGAPLLLGAAYGVLIGLVMVFLLMGRIIGEEKMLLQELKGYGEYQKKVKYRLIPFVW